MDSNNIIGLKAWRPWLWISIGVCQRDWIQRFNSAINDKLDQDEHNLMADGKYKCKDNEKTIIGMRSNTEDWYDKNETLQPDP